MAQAKYKLQYKQSVEKDLRKLTKQVRIAIVQKIQALANEPHPIGSVKLRGSKDLYRVRHADYRVVYQVNNGQLTVLVVKIGHRRDVYREL